MAIIPVFIAKLQLSPKKLSSSYILLIHILLASLLQVESSTIELLHVLYRHGDRTPISYYENDPYKNDSFWPEGNGQLTNKGKAMEYDLGLWLRRRYNDFGGKQFHPSQIQVFSTDVDRTLMSAQCVLAAFYYPSLKSRFNETVNWLPTPVHTSPAASDMLLNVDASCPRISTEVKKMNELPQVVDFMKKHKDLFEYLTNHTGQKIETVMEVDFLYDTLMIEQSHGFVLPNWTNNYMDKIKEVGTFSFPLNTLTPELKRLRGGPLLGKITDNMKKKAASSLDEKIFMFSAHDTTVAILLDTMGVYNKIAPPYASTLLWELHKINDDHVVRLYFQNDSTMVSPPHQLTIPGCTPDCPIDKWISLLADKIPVDWNHECNRPDPTIDQYYIVALSASIICVGLFFTLFLLVLHKLRNGRQQQRMYEQLRDEDMHLIAGDEAR